eukprot:snap_masked-scaffold_37-processed-gene-2.35-mRNA-1 protein AED:0.43 eAED:0.43 QI:0/0/0/0.5/1/1/2/0/509
MYSISFIYFLIYYQHPDDKFNSIFPKFVFISGFTLGVLTLLIVPFDLASNSINIELTWEIFYFLILIYIFILIPFSIFFYEYDDLDLNTFLLKTKSNPSLVSTCCGISSLCKRIFSSCSLLLVLDLVFLILLLIAFFTLNFVNLDVETFDVDLTDFTPLSNYDPSNPVIIDTSAVISSSQTQSINVELSFGLFLISFVTFLGWILFSIYFGIGVVNLPLSLYKEFTHRPSFLSRSTYLLAKKDLYVKLQTFIKRLESLVGVKKTDEKSKKKWKEIKELKETIYEIERDIEDLDMCYGNWKTYNPLVPYFKLVLSFFFLVLEILFLLQIVLYGIFDIADIFGPIFNFSESNIIVNMIFWMVFVIFLVLCVLNGVEKLGMRFMFVNIHPLKMGKTLMSSLLFNLSVFLLSVPPTIHFLLTLIPTFSNTKTAFVFSVMVENIELIKPFFYENIFYYISLAFMVMTSFFIVCCRCCNNKPLTENVNLRRRIVDLKERNALWREEKRKRPEEGS